MNTLENQSTDEWLSHYNLRDMELQLLESRVQNEHLIKSQDLFKALQWLAVACIEVKAWKCIDNAVTILIEPTDSAYDPLIYGCSIKTKGE